MTERGEVSRRRFFSDTAAFLSSGFLFGLASLLPEAAEAAEAFRAAAGEEISFIEGAWNYKISPWSGDDFTLGHRMRMGQLPPLPRSVTGKADFVIVGGGLSGLAAAHYLKDHSFLLLEQYGDFGGQSRGDSYRGIGYSYGAAYFAQDFGETGKLFQEYKLKPVRLSEKRDAFYFDGKWFAGTDGPESDLLYKQFKQLKADCREIWNIFPEDIEKELPLDNAELAKLDATPFSGCLQGYSENFLALLDSFLKSAACGGINHLSALAAYWILEDLVAPVFVLPGGNPALTRAMKEGLQKAAPERMKSGAFVWSVELTENGAFVAYSDREGQGHRVECKHVIVSTPPLVTARILRNMPDSEKARLFWFRYGSYLVANYLLRKPVLERHYDNWFSPPFSFADITVAETPYMEAGSYKESMGSVLTVYQPYPPSSAGRPMLLQGDRKAITGALSEQLSNLSADLKAALERVVVSRWGHAMAVLTPGYFKHLGELSHRHDAGKELPFSLAHCSMHGGPFAESAIAAAKKAADRALKRTTAQ